MNGNRSLLVVDDDPDIREALAAALEDRGYVVEAVADGGAALKALAQTGPRPVLLDLMMPRMDGWTFLSHLRSDAVLCRSPVIVVSAVTAFGVPPGADAVLAKPFEIGDLAALLERICRRRREAGPVMDAVA